MSFVPIWLFSTGAKTTFKMPVDLPPRLSTRTQMYPFVNMMLRQLRAADSGKQQKGKQNERKT